eukprot:scaffold808_cov370-Prasinococcus_capsulatus_cf.AAC.29
MVAEHLQVGPERLRRLLEPTISRPIRDEGYDTDDEMDNLPMTALQYTCNAQQALKAATNSNQLVHSGQLATDLSLLTIVPRSRNPCVRLKSFATGKLVKVEEALEADEVRAWRPPRAHAGAVAACSHPLPAGLRLPVGGGDSWRLPRAAYGQLLSGAHAAGLPAHARERCGSDGGGSRRREAAGGQGEEYERLGEAPQVRAPGDRLPMAACGRCRRAATHTLTAPCVVAVGARRRPRSWLTAARMW